MVSSLDCRFHAVDSGLQELDSEIPIARFRVPRAEFWNLIACITGALSAKQGERGILREAQDKFYTAVFSVDTTLLPKTYVSRCLLTMGFDLHLNKSGHSYFVA